MNTFSTLQTLIRKRRSTKPGDMNGKPINDALVQELLELADWAPTHARTEPWRFVVYGNESKQQFCNDHAELYRTHTDPEKFTAAKYEKLQQQAATVSHIILVYMKRTVTAPVPAVEEAAAVAAAIQNVLLGAGALQIAALWSTGGMTHHPAMKNYLGLAEEDLVMGLLFLGYSDLPLAEGRRKIPLEEKVIWKG